MSYEALSKEISVTTRGKGTYEITGALHDFVASSGIVTGQLTAFVRHTSASLVIMENADPEARTDLHAFSIISFPRVCPFSSTPTKVPTTAPATSAWP